MSQRARYPAISLADAVERLARIYEREGPNSMSGEVAVRHMGYGSLNGASLSVLAALKKYGLLEGRADDIKISHGGVIILSDKDAEDQEERISALQQALTSDPLFDELEERFKGKTTEINVISYLQKKGFRPTAAKSAAKAYIESSSFVHEETRGYNISDRESISSVPMHQPTLTSPDRRAEGFAHHSDNKSEYQEAPIVISGVSQWPVIRLPKRFSAKNWEDMINILSSMKAGFITDKTENNTPATSDNQQAADEESISEE